MLPDQRLTLNARGAVALGHSLLPLAFAPFLLIVLDLVSRAGVVRRDGTLAAGLGSRHLVRLLQDGLLRLLVVVVLVEHLQEVDVLLLVVEAGQEVVLLRRGVVQLGSSC